MGIGDIDTREYYFGEEEAKLTVYPKETIYQKAVNHYGKIPQLRKTQEECGELVAAIGQWLDSRISLKELATEVADVEIMCKQVRVIISDNVVDSEKMKKILRLDNRIKTAKEDK